MDILKKNINEYLKKLTKKVTDGQAMTASESLFEAVCLFILAGKPEFASSGLNALLKSEIALRKGSLLNHYLQKIIFPSFCNAFGLDDFALSETQFKTEQELRNYCREREESLRWHMTIGQRGASLPSESWVEQLLIELSEVKQVSPPDSSDRQKIANSLNAVCDLVQLYTIHEKLEKALELVNVYESVIQTAGLDGDDYVSEDVYLLGIDLAFRAGQPGKGKEHLQRWYLKNKRLILPDISFHALVMLPEVMKALLAGTLAALINLDDEVVTDFMAALQHRLDMPLAGLTPAEEKFDWQSLLTEWEERALASLWQDEERKQLCGVYFPEVLKTKSCQVSGASEAEIAKLEKRLAVKLPRSYREFLQYSNGWYQLESFIKFLNTDEVDWFRVENQEWIDAWNQHTIEVSDEEYYQYGGHQDPVNLRTEYLHSALQISSIEEGSVFLLNPKVVGERGEWEAWEFGTAIPGAYRYRSFWELMKAGSMTW